jgi:A/G-specific adenine glycosylase
MKLWQGLGYYSRARNLHFTAKYLVDHYNGVFPDDIKQLKSLKGVGDYTAAAIASFAFNLPCAVVDGNVMRVISRIFGIMETIDKTSIKKRINKIADDLLPRDSPGLFNQAIMEFGAIQCRPVNPDCNVCCMNNICFARKNNIVNQLPRKTKKPLVRKRYLNYLIISFNKDSKKHLYINKRTGNDIWKNLYDFPRIETTYQTEPDKIILSDEWKSLFKKKKNIIKNVSEVFKHQLTHQVIYARFYEVSMSSPFSKADQDMILIEWDNLIKYAVPRLIEKYLQSR